MSEFMKQKPSEHGQLEIAKAIRSLAGDPYTKTKVLREFADGVPSRAGQSAIASAIRSLVGDTFNGVPDKQEFVNQRASEEGQEEIVDAILYLAENGGIGGEPNLQEVSLPKNQQSLSEVVVEPEEGYDGLSRVVIPKLVDKTVTPGQFSSTVKVGLTEGYGLRQVTVNAIPSPWTRLFFLFTMNDSRYSSQQSVTLSAPYDNTSYAVFRGLTAVQNFTLDTANQIGKNSFLSVKNDNGFTVNAPKVSVINESAFQNSDVTSVTIGNINNDGALNNPNIASKAFAGCTKLQHLYIKWDKYVGLANIDAFSDIPSLTIHVPSQWVTIYETQATNWSALENVVFVGENYD